MPEASRSAHLGVPWKAPAPQKAARSVSYELTISVDGTTVSDARGTLAGRPGTASNRVLFER